MNPDESQMLAQGMKYLVDPVPWRAVDGTSGGPLNSYIISFFLLCGVKAGYVLAHALADVFVCLLLAVAYRTLLRITSRAIAIVGMLPMMLSFGFTRDPDYLHFASEMLPALLLAIGFHLLVVMIQAGRKSNSSALPIPLLLCGLVLGMAPWCKLQAAPIAAALMVVASAHILLNKGQNPHVRRNFIGFWLAAFLPGALILGVVAAGGALGDFWNSYILGNAAYAGAFHPSIIFFTMLWALLSPEIRLLTAVVLLACVVLLFLNGRRGVPRPDSDRLWISGAAACFFLAASFAVCRSSFRFPHYTILLQNPMTYAAALMVSRDVRLLMGGKVGVAKKTLNILAACAATILIVYTGVRVAGLRKLPEPPPNASERIAAEIHEMQSTRPIHSIAIWGWEAGVYVQTGIPPATRDAIGHFVISLGASRPYFRHRFVADLAREKPDLFIDAVAPGAFLWFWSEKNAYESDAELKTYVDEHYVLAKELPLEPGERPVRIFHRRE